VINWALIKTWENWLIIPVMGLFFFMLAAILAPLTTPVSEE
jgi:hypothetical protein